MFGAITQHFAFCICKTQFMWNWSIWEIAKFSSWWLLTILVGYFQLFLSSNNSSAYVFSALVSFIMPFPFGNSFVVFLYVPFVFLLQCIFLSVTGNFLWMSSEARKTCDYWRNMTKAGAPLSKGTTQPAPTTASCFCSWPQWLWHAIPWWCCLLSLHHLGQS